MVLDENNSLLSPHIRESPFTPYLDSWVAIRIGDTSYHGILTEVNFEQDFVRLCPYLHSCHFVSDLPSRLSLNEQEPLTLANICKIPYAIVPWSRENIEEVIANYAADLDRALQKRAEERQKPSPHI